jgi:uncharacterized protein (DUF4415 family)
LTRIRFTKATPIDYSDIPELPDDFWTHNPPAAPHTKRQITLRLDSDVVEFFRAQGGHYQTRINAVLRTYVDSITRLRSGAQGRRSDQSASRKAAKASRPAHGGKGRASRGGG